MSHDALFSIAVEKSIRSQVIVSENDVDQCVHIQSNSTHPDEMPHSVASRPVLHYLV